jgi:hypothetical protein
MGRNDYGRTPNVWQPAEVPPPFTGHDLGVGPAPTYGPVTTTTVTEYGYPPTSGGGAGGATGRGWRLLLDRSPETLKANGTFEFDRFDIEPSTAALQIASVWKFRNLDTVNRSVTIFIRMAGGSTDVASTGLAVAVGDTIQALAVFLFTGVLFRRVDASQVAFFFTGAANVATAGTQGGTGVPNNAAFSALHYSTNPINAGGIGPSWLDATNTLTLTIHASAINVEMTLRRLHVRVTG